MYYFFHIFRFHGQILLSETNRNQKKTTHRINIMGHQLTEFQVNMLQFLSEYRVLCCYVLTFEYYTYVQCTYINHILIHIYIKVYIVVLRKLRELVRKTDY